MHLCKIHRNYFKYFNNHILVLLSIMLSLLSLLPLKLLALFHLRITIGSPCRCSDCSWAHDLATSPQSRSLLPFSHLEGQVSHYMVYPWFILFLHLWPFHPNLISKHHVLCHRISGLHGLKLIHNIMEQVCCFSTRQGG